MSTKDPKPSPEIVPCSCENEKIFLLEFILDKLTVSYCIDFMLRCIRGPDCLSFKFLDYGPFEVIQNEAITNECQGLKTGTSCIFVLEPKQLRDAEKNFDVDVQVFRRTPDQSLPIGVAKIPLQDLLGCVNTMYEEDCGHRDRYSKILRGDYKLVRTDDVPASCDEPGCFSCSIRLTCFGKMLQSEFQVPDDDEEPSYVHCPSQKCTKRVS